MTIWLAIVDTRHFEFSAIGWTRDDALTSVMAAWEVQVDYTGADPDHISDDDVRLYEMEVGVGYRDWSQLWPKRDSGSS